MKNSLIILFYHILINQVDSISIETMKNEKELLIRRNNAPGVTYLPPDINSSEHYNIPPSIELLPPTKNVELEAIANANPILAALLLTSTLGIPHKPEGFNHPQHLPVNPYVALFLSHYGRYVPAYERTRGIYGYTAANNYHNNKPFGSYKIYEDDYN